ncbi:MAG TPA: TonB-dependent receptor [Chthoniobacterales bacterium]|jgi:iron complex outermembrane receptor protein|nr:TonB-dependent receptor [Chthoniobacterales bacterium]
MAASAFAQAPTPAPDVPNAPVSTEATTERVIVTGSYIPTAETESALPVTVYTAEVLKKQGANTPIEGLRQLPSFVGNAPTENNSNGGDGTAYINLRAIGPENVLTMINGRRAFQFADINAIPISALSRTEILKDGAAAVYGSDAVAGVVNFILLSGPGEKPYEGAELFALYGNTTETDAHVRQVYLRGGVTGLDGKVAIAASGEYYSRANLYSRDRAKLAGTANVSNSGPGALGRGGNSTLSATFAGRVVVSANNATNVQFPTTGSLVLNNLGETNVTPASYRNFAAVNDPSAFNFRAFTPAIPAVENAMYFVTGSYKIFGDHLQLYGDIMYSHTKQDNGLAGSPFIITSQFNGLNEVRASDFNPFGNRITQLRYRLQQELAGRRSFFDKNYSRYVAGVRGDFNIKDNAFISRFGYDAGFVYENLDYKEVDSGDATVSGIRTQIAPVGYATAAGVPALAGDPTGLFNPFIGQNAPITGTAPIYNNTNPLAPEFQTGVPIGTAAYDNRQGALNASYIGQSLFYERDWLADVKVNATFFPNLYNGGFSLALGYEHRESRVHNIPDRILSSGDTLGFNGGATTKTLQEVDSWFGEIIFPVVTSTMNVPFVRSFEIAVAFRHESFFNKDQFTKEINETTNVNPDEDFYGSPRVSLRYQPIADLTLRANWNQSFRGPSPGELFLPTIQDFPVLFDTRNGFTLQPPEGVYRGGNTTLIPETTDTYSAGLIYTPKWLPGFTMTVDWYSIYTTNLILSGNDFAQVLVSQQIIDPDGFGRGANNPGAPGGPGLGATYDPVTNELIAVDSSTGNAGKRFVQGLDVVAIYDIPTERWGRFTFSLGWNHFFTWKAQADPGAGATNFLGNYNNSTIPLAPGGIPFNRGFLRGEWEWHHFDLVVTGNYVGDYEDDPSFIAGNSQLDSPDRANINWVKHHRVSSYETLDLQLSYTWVKPDVAPAPYVKESKDSKAVAQTEAPTASIWQRMLWDTKLTVGVNNVFDRYPPTVLGAFNDNYDTSNYSIRNRYYYISLTKKF